MKHHLLARVCFFGAVVILFGAGCQRLVSNPKSSPAVSETRPAKSALCTANPTENATGARVYPIAPAYSRLPHLGQIFTAIDCGNRERAQQVFGFVNGIYTAGARLSFKTELTAATADALSTLGFTKTSKGKTEIWTHASPLTLDALETLKRLLANPQVYASLESEDCILCG